LAVSSPDASRYRRPSGLARILCYDTVLCLLCMMMCPAPSAWTSNSSAAGTQPHNFHLLFRVQVTSEPAAVYRFAEDGYPCSGEVAARLKLLLRDEFRWNVQVYTVPALLHAAENPLIALS